MFAIPVYATVSATGTKRQFFTATGGTTYTFTMPVNSEDDIRVQKRVTTTGVTTVLTQDVDYTIAPTASDYLNGGVVTIAPALATTFEVIVIREIVQTQETDSGAVNAASLELALDKLTRQVQDLRNDFDQRAVKLPESDSLSLTTTLGDSVSSAGLNIGRDANGNVTETAQSETSVSFSNFGIDFVALVNALAARDTLVLDTDDPVEFAAITGTTGTYSGVITANDGVTLGAGDDLVGSATSDINMNAFGVTAAGDVTAVSVDIGSTVVVVGTLDDDTMATATDTTLATSESIKAYVDNTTDGDVPVLTDSEANTLLKDHAYLAQTSGFVTAWSASNTAQSVRGFVGTTTDPSGTGVLVGLNITSTLRPFVSFFVGNGKYFEILLTDVAANISWTPYVTGGANPVDQD